MEEIRTGVDLHENNKERFGLPHKRIAKIFVFRLIYGGQAYSYAHDSDFNHISKDQKHWQVIIDEFYNKYRGIARWHESLVREVLSTGQLQMQTGRQFSYPREDVAKRLWFWRPKILNYPVQGTGADLVAIGRVTAWKRLRASGVPHLWVSTVHDSLDLDCEIVLDKDGKVCDNNRVVCKIVKQSIEDVPKNFERLFGIPFDLPISLEIGYGQNLANLTTYKETA